MSKNAHFSSNNCNLHILDPNDALLFVHSIHTNSQHLQMFVQKTAVTGRKLVYICVYLSKQISQ